MIKIVKLITETVLKTKHGSSIRRYRGNVGKQVGSAIYVHKLYADQVIPKEILDKAIGILTRSNPDFQYNCLMVDAQNKTVRFDEAPDFDTAREPHVGNYIVVSLNGSSAPRHGHSDSIWHHKWLWVKDDYNGFDIDKSKEWSKLWLGKLDEPAKGSDASWQSQLKNIGLTEARLNEVEMPAVLLGAIWPDEEIKVVRGEDENARHPFNWSACNKWRYVPEIHYLTWWSTPSSNESMLVKDYLEAHGFPVKRSAILMKESKELKEPDIIFGGIWSNDRIVAHKAVDAPSYGHTREMGANRWVYFEAKETVFWHVYPPFEDSKHSVENFLTRKGYVVNSNRSMKDYYKVMHNIDENKLQLMEARATPKMLEAFMREQIKGSEWDGKVFLVGGFVRDELLGKEPKDADVVVGKFQGGVEFTTWLGKKLGIYHEKTNPVIFPTFGTANLRLDGVVWQGIDFTGESIDAVMFRKEQYHDPNSRKPTVQYTDKIEEDASRRDLTFNAIYKDIASGKILDPTGMGVSDLKNGIVRTPLDPTTIYTDDALRMFRAVRFATQLGFELSPEVVDGIKKNLHRLGNTSKERVRDELNKILLSKNPTRGIRLLRDTGLLPYVASELQAAVGMTQNVHHVHDVFDHTLEVLKNTKPEIVQRLMALFHDIGKVTTRSETPSGVHFYGHEEAGAEIVDRILRDLKYPLDIIDAVKSGVKNHMRLKSGGDDAVKLSDKTLRKFQIELGTSLEHTLDVIHADNIAHASASAMPNQIEKVRQRLKSLNVQVQKPVLPINGNDLMAMGIPKGPKIGKALAAVTDAWYENPNITKDDAIAIIRGML